MGGMVRGCRVLGGWFQGDGRYGWRMLCAGGGGPKGMGAVVGGCCVMGGGSPAGWVLWLGDAALPGGLWGDGCCMLMGT